MCVSSEREGFHKFKPKALQYPTDLFIPWSFLFPAALQLVSSDPSLQEAMALQNSKAGRHRRPSEQEKAVDGQL